MSGGVLQIGQRPGTPARFPVVAAYGASAIIWLLAATATLATAVPDLVGARPDGPRVLLAVHLLALGFLPFAVSAGVLHILPVLLRNGEPSWRSKIALPFLWAGPVLASGIAGDRPSIVYPAAAALGVGVLLLLTEVGSLIAAAPRDGRVLASKTGIVCSAVNVVAAFALGATVFGSSENRFGGLNDDRVVAIHLTLAVLGWLTLLIVTVGRTLAPTLAGAPAAATRRWPVDEILLTVGVWLVIAGIAGVPGAALGGVVLVVTALVRFARLLNRVRRGKPLRGFEAPLLHFLAGLVFLAQAAGAGIVLLSERSPSGRLEEICVLFLLGGWAAGVTLGHLGKLLSLSAWASWPRGPRPHQDQLYPRRVWLAEALCFSSGIEIIGAGIVLRCESIGYTGTALLVAAAIAALGGLAVTIRAGRPPAN